MKKLFTLFLGGLVTVSAFANDVTVTFSGNKKYEVVIDGRSISGYGYNGNTININDLRIGQHSLQVYKSKGNNTWNNNNVVYSSDFTIRPQYDLFINVDKKGRVQMDERINNNYGNNGGYGTNDGNWGNNRRRHHHDDNYGNNDQNDRYGRNSRNDGDDDDYGRNNGSYGSNNGSYGNNGGWNNNYSNAMSDADFNQLLQKIRGQWFGKLSTAKTSVTNNYLATYQVRQILQIFSSENDKLQLAELAYRNTVDQNNFRQLYDLFSYQGQAALDNYIRNYRY